MSVVRNTILVTGGTGFIGRHLVERLCNQGYRAIVLTRQKEATPPLPNTAEIVSSDLGDFGELALGKITAVFHLAAAISFAEGDFDELERVNAKGTERIVEWAKKNKVPDFVHISSGATCTCPSRQPVPADETTTFPSHMKNSHYGYPYTKWLSEEIVRSNASSFRRAVIVNPVTVWGAGDRTFNAGYLLKLAQKSLLFWAPPGGTSVVSVHDVTDGIIAAWHKGKSGSRYLLAAENIPYRDLFSTVNAVVGRRPPSIALPSFLYNIGHPVLSGMEGITRRLGLPAGQINSQMLENLFSFRYFSSEKAQKELGWRPKFSPLEMIEETWDYYQKERLL
ncbi:MAG: NAD-dependent epimerase/dehydratase family protein [Pseudomonadota bacterium]